AGLLALRAPRPTLVGSAKEDFLPIEGARESAAEARNLFAAAGAADHFSHVEAEGKHGLSPTLRKAVYAWFERWLRDRDVGPSADEVAVEPRAAKELQVCADGQVNITFRSRPLLPLALEEFRARKHSPSTRLDA